MGGGTTDWDAAALAVCATTDRGPAARAAVPRFEGDGQTVQLERGEQLIGSLPATHVRYRVPAGTDDLRWGPLNMRVTVTSHRIVLNAVAGNQGATEWAAAPDDAPLVLHTVEPTGARRGLEPVRIAGHVRWARVSRVDAEGSLIAIVMPIARGCASLTLHVPSQLGHRVLAAARAAFVGAHRFLAVDTPFRVDAGPDR